MSSRIARANQPVVRLIGRRLAAAPTPERMRRVIGGASKLMAPCRGVERESITIAGRDGLRLTPKRGAGGARTALMFHGGGYVFGSPGMYAGLAGRIAKAAAATVVVPTYRLAPEHPYPAAIDDGLAVYRELVDEIPPAQLSVGGDSAGGGMTVAVLQAAHAEGLPMPGCAFLMSPWLDLTGSSESHTTNEATEMLIRPESVTRASGYYRGPIDADDARVSPLFGDLTALPPTLVQVSDSELLFSDSVAFHERASAAGVAVDLRVESGLWHVWQLMAPAVPEARRSIDEIGEFVARHTAD